MISDLDRSLEIVIARGKETSVTAVKKRCHATANM